MATNQILNDYFTLTRKDRTGIITIMVLIGLTLVAPVLLKRLSPRHDTLPADTGWIAAVRQLEIKQESANTRKERPVETIMGTSGTGKEPPFASRIGQLFFFDPNNTTAADWQRLEVNEKTVRTIQHYLSKGGSFKKPEDLKKIYGLRDDDYARLAPFIRIPEKNSFQVNEVYTGAGTSVRQPAYAAIDINKADTSAFIALPGIGSKLAARIVNFRDKLGGFYAVEQVAETYGLPDSLFQKAKPYLRLDTATFKKININTATTEELKAHPYIKWNVANALIAYRVQHGPYAKTEDIKKIMLITDELYSKVSLYLTVQ